VHDDRAHGDGKCHAETVPEGQKALSRLSGIDKWRKDGRMSFTAEEIAYLRSRPLARFATVGTDEQPDVVPVAFELDAGGFWVGGSGGSVLRTRKFRNVAAGRLTSGPATTSA
jgi:hypothetical protein